MKRLTKTPVIAMMILVLTGSLLSNCGWTGMGKKI